MWLLNIISAVDPIFWICAGIGLFALAACRYADCVEAQRARKADAAQVIRGRLTDPSSGEHAVLELRQVGPAAVHSYIDGRWSGWEWPSMEAAIEHIRDSFLDEWRLEWLR